MRNLILGIVGAAAVALATPAVAQVHVDVPGVGVRVGSDNHRHHQGHNRGYREGHNRGYRARAQANCRQVTTRTVRPNGAVVVKKSTRCN